MTTKRRSQKDVDSSLEAVLDLVEGRLDTAASATVEAAVADSPTVQTSRQWVDQFRSSASHLVIEEPPTRLHQQLVNLGNLLPEPPPGLLDRLVASLQFDSWAQSFATPTLRHLDTESRQRHLLFTAVGVDVAIDLYWEDDAVEVLGLILSEADGVREVEEILLEDQQLDISIDVSPSGEFGFRIEAAEQDATPDHVALSTLEMVVRVGEHRIQVGPLAGGEVPPA